MLNRTLTIVALVFVAMALCLAGLGWYFYTDAKAVPDSGRASGSSQFTAPSPDHSFKPVVCHDITQGCGNDHFIVRFDRIPHVMHPFGVTVEVGDAVKNPTTGMHVSFAMAGMEMGLNRYRMLQQQDKAWHAEVTLPVCVQGKSLWNMQLEFKSAIGTERYRLTFESPGSLH